MINKKIKKCFEILLYIFLLYGFIYLLLTNKLGHFLIQIENYLTQKKQSSPLMVYSILAILISTVIIFSLPSHLLIMTFCCIVIGDSVQGFIFVYLISLLVSVFIYQVLIHKIEFIKEKISQNLLFDQIKTISKEAPLRTAIIVRFLFIPGGFKEYLLSSIDLSFKNFFVSGILGHMFYCLEGAIISSEFKTIQDFIQHPKSWSEKSLFEKVFFFLTIIVILITMIVMFVIGSRLMKQIKKKNQLEFSDVTINDLSMKGNSFQIIFNHQIQLIQTEIQNIMSKLSPYYQQLQSQINSYTNLSNIFDKLESDKKLEMIGDFYSKLFQQEMLFAVAGFLIRIEKNQKFNSSNQSQKATLFEFINFQREPQVDNFYFN